MKYLVSIVLAVAVLIFGIGVLMNKVSDKNSEYTYIITETAQATSLDPLEADQTINMPVTRMIYATPVEINLNGDLTSSLLESFEYDEKSNAITWIAKSGLKYSNGSTITTEDIAFAVARMIQARPNFPVIEDIKGVTEWLKEKIPLKSLPSGINVNGNTIKISFDKKQDHPLFRFCLELFSVIPKSCVNLENGKIECTEIPTSGYYKIISQSKNLIKFQLNSEKSVNLKKAPEKIIFKYLTTQELMSQLDSLDKHTIIAGTDLQFSADQMKNFKAKVNVSFAPASRIVSLLINPEVGAFRDINCRHVFADAFRTTFNKVANDIQLLEYSTFTDLLPGYMKTNDLVSGSTIKLTAQEKENCKRKLQEFPVKWIKAKNSQNSIFVRVMEQVFKELGIPNSEPFELETLSKAGEMFLNGEVSVVSFQTGFWAFDPAGDVQMLMTPNMHKALKFVCRDEKMQKLIRNLKKSNLDKKSFVELNQQIYDEATFNIYTHIRRFYASADQSLIAEAPVSITSPAPWQVFKVQGHE